MYGGLNHEFGVRNLEETLALTMENEGEEGFLERERVFTVWDKKGSNPYVKCSKKWTNHLKTRG